MVLLGWYLILLSLIYLYKVLLTDPVCPHCERRGGVRSHPVIRNYLFCHFCNKRIF
jgi:hypothetical protein